MAENSCNREENQGVRLGAEQFAWENDRLYTVEENLQKSLIFSILQFKRQNRNVAKYETFGRFSSTVMLYHLADLLVLAA